MDKHVNLSTAIRDGDVEALRRLLSANPGLANVRVVDEKGVSRTPLHIATDWPGHFPNVATTISMLIAAGAETNAVVTLPDAAETPLHWAASSNDVAAIDALLDGGADIEAPGAVFTGGTPLSDAVVFAQWNAARRLVERGARTTLWQAAALGLLERVRSVPEPDAMEITNAFWHACRGGQRQTAEYLLQHGADANWVGHQGKTPLDVALESGANDLIQWLKGRTPRP